MIERKNCQVEIMVPKRLKAVRDNSGLSQERFLQLADVDSVSDKSQISKYESGKSTPPFEFVVKIAKALDYPEAYFYTIDDVFAESILQLHRNKHDPEFNPYITELNELKRTISEAQKITVSLTKHLKIGAKK